MKSFLRIVLLAFLSVFLLFLIIEAQHSTQNFPFASKTVFPTSFKVKDFPVDPDQYKNKQVAIYVVPHADDETLTYSVPILNDLREKKEVFVILSSHGESTGAWKVVNKRVIHDITRRQLGAARIKEFHEACKKFGIPSNHVVVYNLMIDTHNREIDRKKFRTILTHYAKQFPQAEFKGMSEFDMNADHSLVGEVINELKQEGVIQKTEFYLSINMARFCPKVKRCIKHIKEHGKPTVTRTEHLIQVTDKTKIINATKVYKKWDPENGWYAIGHISVPKQFQALTKDPYTLHTPK